MSRIALDRVRKYYDDNTASFERFGQGHATIHRAVWAPGVQSRTDAFAYIDARIEEELAGRFGTARELRVLDLGCGLGASLMRLCARRRMLGVGVTISPVQVERATAIVADAGLASRIEIIERSFTDLPEDMGSFDVGFAIEAFVHSPSAEQFFEAVAARLRPGGVLIVVDDFLTSAGESTEDPAQQRLLSDFMQCWLANTSIGDGSAAQIAERFGFRLVRNEDWTSHLELRRPRDLAISALVKLGGRLPIPGERWRAWKGGDALQLALKRGLVAFRYLVFERA